MPVEWRIHLGAHKTATTHLQRTIEAVRPGLAGAGIDALPLQGVRPVWRGYAARWIRRRSVLARFGAASGLWVPGAAEFGAALDRLRSGPPVLLISEENLLGEAAAGLGLYPAAGRRLTFLRGLTAGAPVHLFLAIRRMDGFLPSIYAEALRFFPVPRPFERACGPALLDPPRWTDLVAAIRRALPEATLTVWRYESYAGHERAVLARIAGADPGPLPVLPRPVETMSPSAAAVRAVEAMDDLDTLAIGARSERVAAAYAAAPAGPDAPPFRPLDAAAVARCASAYDEDCAALARQGLLWSPGGD